MPETMNPGALAGAHGARVTTTATAGNPENSRKPRKPATIVRVHGESQDRMVRVFGRDAWALRQLMAAGEDGCTPLHNPAPRWSHYVYKLRRAGIDVETVREPHGGPYAGHHARYVLRDKVSIEAEGVT